MPDIHLYNKTKCIIIRCKAKISPIYPCRVNFYWTENPTQERNADLFFYRVRRTLNISEIPPATQATLIRAFKLFNG